MLDRNAADACVGWSSRPALDDVPDELWVHELVGATVRDAAAARCRHRASVEANPASDLLVLETGGLVPVRFVTAHEPAAGRSTSTSPRGCSTCDAPAVRIDVFTIFPDVVAAYCGMSSSGRAAEAGLLDVRVHDLRDGADDARRSVDDRPFGGGAGMVLSPEPVFAAVESVPEAAPAALPARPGRPALRSGGGRGAGRRRPRSGFSLLCGRYEGVDQRVADHLVDGELSVGDFVLAGGELAALVVVEAVPACCPTSWATRTPPWTRASPTGCWSTPSTPGRPISGVGRSPRCCGRGTTGRWPPGAARQALLRTAERRPDLLARLVRASALSASDVQALAEHGYHVPFGTEPV